jgi:hypothetical protein
LGECLLGQNKFAEAEPPLRECLAIRAEKWPNHNSYFHTQSMLGAALAGQQRSAEAEPLLWTGYQGLAAREQAIPFHDKHRVKDALDRLMQFYED